MNIKRTTELAIESLTDVEKLQLIEQYEQFEQDGCIGDCELRMLAQKLPGCGPHVAMFMTLLTNECYRYFANKYLNETDKGMNLQQKQ